MPGTPHPIVSTVPKDDPREFTVHQTVPTVYESMPHYEKYDYDTGSLFYPD